MDYEKEFEQAIHHLLWIWRQYGGNSFSHGYMQAGEQATDFLEKHGYGHDQGWCFEPNEKALGLMNKEFD